MMSEASYARAIRDELRSLEKIAQTTMSLVRVVKVLAPLEAQCARTRCFGTSTCTHLRVDVLALFRRPGGDKDLPYTAIFAAGDDPGSPLLVEGWGA